jgi:DNA-binding transcriptional regulator YdaS (Cro superfamily)
MKLETWLTKNCVRRSEFAERIGVVPSMITAYCAGESVPQPKTMEEIFRQTGGKVTPNDFHNLERAR